MALLLLLQAQARSDNRLAHGRTCRNTACPQPRGQARQIMIMIQVHKTFVRGARHEAGSVLSQLPWFSSGLHVGRRETVERKVSEGYRHGNDTTNTRSWIHAILVALHCELFLRLPDHTCKLYRPRVAREQSHKGSTFSAAIRLHIIIARCATPWLHYYQRGFSRLPARSVVRRICQSVRRAIAQK
jgi:hypothetical protein